MPWPEWGNGVSVRGRSTPTGESEPFDIEEVKRDGGGLRRFSDWITAIPTIPPPLLPQRWIRWDGDFTCMTSTMKKKMLNSDIAAMLRRKGICQGAYPRRWRSPNPMRICGISGDLRLTAARRGRTPSSTESPVSRNFHCWFIRGVSIRRRSCLPTSGKSGGTVHR